MTGQKLAPDILQAEQRAKCPYQYHRKTEHSHDAMLCAWSGGRA
jgi:hypothetical protein